MTQRRRAFGIVLVAVAATALMAGDRSNASGDKATHEKIQAIADAVQKNESDKAEKLAQNFASKDKDPVYNSMVTMKPRDDDKAPGFGVGKPGDKIEPDGIEQMVKELATNPKVAIPKKEALEEMANRIKAVALVTQTKEAAKEKKFPNDWKKLSDTMVKKSQEFADAVKGGNEKMIRKAAASLDSNCNNCHEKFR